MRKHLMTISLIYVLGLLFVSGCASKWTDACGREHTTGLGVHKILINGQWPNYDPGYHGTCCIDGQIRFYGPPQGYYIPRR